ncbi:hypothetical protein HELRODRAFT_108719 [Helobdella robusta]|uniref:Methyltransferase type 12 domain-containing protein n=1 Tax=Helobdella robusta TaxID=6412 RepID=T1EEL7_HELRO|nr:hypothetical protein HELRODRAFT_108719 [Helobdella robusta]ESN90649.1 hypothetical protein HELRODRAFT_108719 [Helobdella robusta]
MTSVTVLRSAAAEKNKRTILGELKKILNEGDDVIVLEVASGTGQHVTFFAEHLPHVTWFPSECNDVYMTSIQGYTQITHRQNVKDALWIDTRDEPDSWGKGGLQSKVSSFDYILCINMLHYCEWNACKGLFKGVNHYLKNGGSLLIYGPFIVENEQCSEENQQFDCMLRQQNSEWGLRETAHMDIIIIIIVIIVIIVSRMQL